MIDKPLVTILIPVYMRAELAIEAIDCALAQDYENTEIIVGDNCSTDGTYETLLKRYKDNPKVLLFQNEENLGAVGNWERCFAKAKGKYVKFLWSDDLMSKDFISKSVNLLEENPDAAFAYSTVVMFSDTQQLKNIKTKGAYRLYNSTGIHKGEEFIAASYETGYKVPVSPGCAIFRKDKLHIIADIPNKPGYVHRRNGAGPDLLMFLEALRNGESIIYIDSPDSFFRAHPQSISISDDTIMDGYWTAKQYYLKETGNEKYWRSLNTEIISHVNRKRFFNRANNIKTLSKYMETDDPHIKEHSVLETLIRKVIQKIYWITLK